MKYLFRLLLVGIVWSNNLHANNRVSTANSFLWLTTNNTVKLNNRVSTWVEYQWRRTDMGENWQQSLLRVGSLYKFNDRVSAGIGYAWVESFPYGEYPARINKPYPEHRIFQQVNVADKIGRVQLQHRGRLEQRMLGILAATSGKEQRALDRWNYLNRIRYQLSLVVPINNALLENNTLYATAYDELFLGFGKNVQQNVFDQNRTGFTLGYKLNNNFRIEGGYFHLVLQQSGTTPKGEQIFQYNNGAIVNFITNW